ncbi:hypothetical protein DVS28_a1491 [Euzebya pacifica]|uniref:Uncharacterized protein n=1 Tax=Euzebya pacifica TaxID=1608957 RepID=A0A346XVD7_9ACTN|nr:hypothetical protein DVS28_a1491 [Euzebya pacifica]
MHTDRWTAGGRDGWRLVEGTHGEAHHRTCGPTVGHAHCEP